MLYNSVSRQGHKVKYTLTGLKKKLDSLLNSRLVEDFNAAFRIVTSTYLSFSIILITTTLLQIQESISTNSWSVVGRSITTIFTALFWFFLLCDTGEELTSQFQSISYLIYDSPWYDFPLNLQKYYPMMLAIAQKPIYLQGIGNRCTRKTFKRVYYYFFSVIIKFLIFRLLSIL